MSSLKRVPSGAWKARKGIPADVRAEYQALYGAGWEAIFHAPAGTPAPRAKLLHAEWLALVEGRIHTLRATGSGKVDLTQRQAHALAAEWYRWFTAQHLDNPGDHQRWARLQEILLYLLELDEADALSKLAVEARADQFLTDRGVALHRPGGKPSS